MKRFITIILIILAASIIAGIYGIIHDQVTYTISPEYYTHFKFIQFGFIESSSITVANARALAALVGFMATWWVGLLLGIVLCFFTGGFTNKQAFIYSIKAILIILSITFISGIAGYLNGLFLIRDGRNSFFLQDVLLPQQAADDFTIVGSIHNFGYSGSVIGLLAGVAYMVWQKKKLKV